MAAIALRELTKVFGDGTVAVDRLTLDVSPGELMVLLGPTGCGKSTVLRLVAGLEEATSGEVLFDGEPVDHLQPRQRNVAMVFQDYALYPHLTVYDNIAFPLRAAQLDENVIAARVGQVVGFLGIEPLLGRLPTKLSGGQRQRVAMARAVVRRPGAFLLDEPLSNLDAHLREDLRAEIVRLTREFGVTTLYVTHDRTEALTMATRVAVLRRGVLQQLGAPDEVYSDPATVFVAAFLGPGQTSLLQSAVYAEPDGDVVVDLGTQVLRLPAGDRRAVPLAAHHTERLTVGIRADALRPVPADSDSTTTAFYRDPLGIVHLKGAPCVEDLFTSDCESGLSVPFGGVPIFTLPAGYRPDHDWNYEVVGSNGGTGTDGRISVHPDGSVRVIRPTCSPTSPRVAAAGSCTRCPGWYRTRTARRHPRPRPARSTASTPGTSRASSPGSRAAT